MVGIFGGEPTIEAESREPKLTRSVFFSCATLAILTKKEGKKDKLRRNKKSKRKHLILVRFVSETVHFTHILYQL